MADDNHTTRKTLALVFGATLVLTATTVGFLSLDDNAPPMLRGLQAPRRLKTVGEGEKPMMEAKQWGQIPTTYSSSTTTTSQTTKRYYSAMEAKHAAQYGSIPSAYISSGTSTSTTTKRYYGMMEAARDQQQHAHTP